MGAGASYLKRLSAGRSVWLNGQKIEQLKEHPAFRGTIQSIVRVLDRQDDPDDGPILTYETEVGGRAHQSFRIPASREEVAARGRAMALWSEATFGMMSRVGVTYRAQIAGFYAGRERFRRQYPDYAERIEAYYRYVRDRDLLVTSAGHDPQINRSQTAKELAGGEAALRIVRRTSEGLVIRGAKTLATGSPYHDEIIVSPLGMRSSSERDYAFLLAVASGTPGLHHICREPFVSDDALNHPLSARYDEMDAVLVFDDVMVPWERVFLHGDPEALAQVRRSVEPGALGLHESVARLSARLMFVLSVAHELALCIGSLAYAHVRQKLAELIVQAEGIAALVRSSERAAAPSDQGVWLAHQPDLVSAKNLGNRYFPRAVEILQQLAGAGLLQTPADLTDLQRVLGGRLQHYYQGADRNAMERGRLMKLVWDLIGSAFGARGELYERFYAGDPARTYGAQYAAAAAEHQACMAKGWLAT